MGVGLTQAVPALYDVDERRVDGSAKVSGQAQYTADLKVPEMLHAAFACSALPHARILEIDVSAARAMPGVRAVLTGADIGERYFGRRLFDWPVLAFGKVRFVGEYVAAVAAETSEIAAAAAAAIDVRYEELEPLLDPRAAIAPDAPVLHPDRNAFPVLPPHPPPVPHPNMQGYDEVQKGDVAEGFARSDRVFEHTFSTPRYHAGYLEPHASLVWIDHEDVVHVAATHKAPFLLRDALALTTGVPKEQIIIEPSFIGGDFGAKGLSVEVFASYYLARATKRPIRYIRSYVDDIQSTSVRHASEVTVRVGVRKHGEICALELTTIFDGGAYAGAKIQPSILPGPVPKLAYCIPNIKVVRIAAYTNSIPGGFLRAPGDVQIIFALESHLDMVAREIGLDPLTFRRRNAISNGDTDALGSPVIAPRVTSIIDTLWERSCWDEPLPPGRGRGVALAARHIGGGTSNVLLTVLPTGKIHVQVGATEPGVGTLTVVQRVIAGELGLDPASVTVERGSTNAVPFDPGIGASRSTHIVGQAALNAATVLRERLLALTDPRAVLTDALAALAAAGPVTVTGSYSGDAKPGEPEYLNFAGYVVTVTVDRDTGELRIDDVQLVVEVGSIINPVAHRGQLDGGFLMGLGHSTSEELVVEDGRILNPTLAEYKLPTARDMPPLDVTYLRSPGGPGPHGARAVGELNVAGVGPAIANAIAAATGVRLDSLPLTAERIYAALRSDAAR